MDNKKETMSRIAKKIASDRKETFYEAPERVSSSHEIDIAAILSSGLGSEKALTDNGEIIRNL